MNTLFLSVDIDAALAQIAAREARLIERAGIAYRSTGHPAQVQANDALRWRLLFSLLNTPKRPIPDPAPRQEAKEAI